MYLSEMKSFIGALKITISGKTGNLVPIMDTAMNMEQHREVFKKTRESTASPHLGYTTEIILRRMRVTSYLISICFLW